MNEQVRQTLAPQSLKELTHTARLKYYPGGAGELLACDKPVFRYSGWEDRRKPPRSPSRPPHPQEGEGEAPGPGDLQRAVRRARQRVRDLALCNEFRYFVTLTLDKAHVDRYDMAAITRKLNAWLSNQVARRGLKYVLVPERHKDGAIHFHGFFNGALEGLDSGTISGVGPKPKKPRTAAQRAAWLASGGHVVYNLPRWTLGFSTAIELYGEYHKAVSYVCKYIGKELDPEGQPVKLGGRWYYSGGGLAEPVRLLLDVSWRETAERSGAYCFQVPEAGAAFALLRLEPEQTFDILTRYERGELTFLGLSDGAANPCAAMDCGNESPVIYDDERMVGL